MKKILLFLTLLTLLTFKPFAQNDAISDAVNLELIGNLYYDSVIKEVQLYTRNGVRITSFNLGDYYATKLELEALKQRVLTIESFNIQTGNDAIPGRILRYNRQQNPDLIEGYAYYADGYTFESLLDSAARFRNLLAQFDSVKAFCDSLRGSQITVLSPHFALSDSSIDFGTSVTKDTTATIGVMNSGNAMLSCSFQWNATNENEPNPNPFSLTYHSPFNVDSSDTSDLIVNFAPRIEGYFYEWDLIITHNANNIVNIDTFHVTGQLVISSVGNTYYVSPWGGSDTLTYTEARAKAYLPGDQIKFLRGYSYSGGWGLLKDTSTTAVLTITDYGSGNKPIIKYANFNTNPVLDLTNINYVVIKNVDIHGFDSLSSYCDIVQFNNAHHIYFENSSVIGGTHANFVTQKNSSNKSSHHIAARFTQFFSRVHSNLNLMDGSYALLLDRCNLMRGGYGSPSAYSFPGQTDHLGGFALYGIPQMNVRRTVIQCSGISGWGKSGAAIDGRSRQDADGYENNMTDSYIFQNTFKDTYDGGIVLGVLANKNDFAPYLDYGDNRFFNNIFTNCFKQAAGRTNGINRPISYNMDVFDDSPPYTFPYAPQGDIWKGNMIGETANDRILYYTGQNYFINVTEGNPSITTVSGMSWTNNIAGTPNFVNTDTTGYCASQDLTLQTGSDGIDDGEWFTTVTSSNGTGTTFTVADGGFFFDGWGLTYGDSIQVGTDIVLITSRSGNSITVTPSFTWANGDHVSFPIEGVKPDIGAMESQ